MYVSGAVEFCSIYVNLLAMIVIIKIERFWNALQTHDKHIHGTADLVKIGE